MRDGGYPLRRVHLIYRRNAVSVYVGRLFRKGTIPSTLSIQGAGESIS